MGLKDLLTIPDGRASRRRCHRRAGSLFRGRLRPTWAGADAGAARPRTHLFGHAAGRSRSAPRSQRWGAMSSWNATSPRWPPLAPLSRGHSTTPCGNTPPPRWVGPFPRVHPKRTASAESPEPVKVWQESTRHWLMEIAIAGFGTTGAADAGPVQRHAGAVAGRAANDAPRRSADRLPTRIAQRHAHRGAAERARFPLGRPVDAGHDRGLRPPALLSGKKISGTLAPLGIDLRHHGYFVSADVYGVLERRPTARGAHHALFVQGGCHSRIGNVAVLR